MEELVRNTMLFDFYGELLTERQQRIFEKVVLDDTGYSEAAEDEGISRQGVHDMVHRVIKQLESYEEKLRLLERFLSIRESVGAIEKEASEAEKNDRRADTSLIMEMTGRILKEL